MKLNVQLSREHRDKLAKAIGNMQHRLVVTAFEAWKRVMQHKKSVLTTAVVVLRHRCLKACFFGWRLMNRATAHYRRHCATR